MFSLPRQSKSNRNKKAFELMYLAAESHSDQSFTREVAKLNFKYLPNYSYGDLEKPRLCCKVVQNIDNPKEIYVLNRGLSRKTMNFSGFIEELPEMIRAARRSKPEDTEVLSKKLYDINRDLCVEELTVVGHSRGALVVDYNADNEYLLSHENRSCRVVSIESPGTSLEYKVRNPSYVEYISNFSNIINCCGTSSSDNPIAIQNYSAPDEGKDFLHHSFQSHKIESMYENFYNQTPLEKRISCFHEAYENFIEQGGKCVFSSRMAIKSSDFVKNMGEITTNIFDFFMHYVRPNSYPTFEPEVEYYDYSEIFFLANEVISDFWG